MASNNRESRLIRVPFSASQRAGTAGTQSDTRAWKGATVLVAEVLAALALALVGPGTMTDHFSPGQMSEFETHFEQVRIEAERQAAEQRRQEAAERRAERREREKQRCVRDATITRDHLEARVSALGKADQFHAAGISTQRDADTLTWLIWHDWEDHNPLCDAFTMTENAWLFDEIRFAEAVELIDLITKHYDERLPVNLTDHISVSSDLSKCDPGVFACEISMFQGDYPLRSTIHLPDPVERYVVLHELAHSIAHFQYGLSAGHSVEWLTWQVKLLADVQALDIHERCPWFALAGIELPMCRALGF